MTRRDTQADRAAFHDEHLRRMAEPEPYRSLRQQKERIESERAEAVRRAHYEREAEVLRREIRELGEKPCA